MSFLFSRKSKRESYRPQGVRKRLDKSLGPLSGPRPPRKKTKPEPEKKQPAPLPKWAQDIDWSRWRIKAIIGVFCVLWIGLWGRAWYLQMVEGPRLGDMARRQHMASELVSGKRGLIFDRNGQVLARSVEARSVYANPAAVENVEATARTLGEILDIKPEKLVRELEGKKRFVWIKRKVDDVAATAVRKADLPGIGLSREYDRFYPFKHMAGQLLGFVGMDDKGLEGIERSLDDTLGTMPVRQIVQRDAMGRKFYLHEAGRGEPVGEDVTLTLDMQIQFIAEEAIARVAQEFDAMWSGALVVDLQNGDILAWAQYPFFNPNTYKESTPRIYRNRLASDALEPGSTFKPFVMAAAIQEKKVTPNTLIDCEGGKWTNRNYTIRDTSTRGVIPASKVLRYSSNIGMAKIGLSLGARQMHKYLSQLGFGEAAVVPIANSRGILRRPRDWGESDIMAASFGQSLSVTCLQMAQAYATLLNNGVYKPLRLVIEENNVEEMPSRVFNETATKQVLDMMRDVVEERDGTGKRARVSGVEIGGKTGTAQKADQGAKTYGAKRLASFVGFFPAKAPRYLVLVFVDEPTKNPYGGVVAAPAFQEIAGRLLTYTGILNESRVAVAETDKKKERRRGYKLGSRPSEPFLALMGKASVKPIEKEAPGMRNPGHLAKASSNVPDVKGKSVRNAVELFARAGVVPELKGSGSRVVKQTPPAGSPWPEAGKNVNYILWLSER